MDKKVIEGLQTIVTELSQQADGHVIQSRIFASQGLNMLSVRQIQLVTAFQCCKILMHGFFFMHFWENFI